ncbi:TetR/AcrR family transcriptional regulator [Kineosporia succinea]|uniref:AcrR family transcriptional regulator n=1 Tax=Kineosporia succinea TaxID=84632 RepID=A0ABT9PAF9_9ACTN|nr:TetR/AcrR family transcriptional regulator [Kineosporia succinea]MDP9829684.1 AcrR family transcriptional regulator [Kineosporia succinea]
MSPRKLDPQARATLLEIAARLLAVEGPRALSARRIAAEAGSSTMPLYSHFGRMDGLVREIVREGFVRMDQYLEAVTPSADAVADMCTLGRAYRRNAIVNRHLYQVMFGADTLTGFSLTDDDRQRGRYVLIHVVNCAQRCIDSGRFRRVEAETVAHQMWFATHGLVSLELGDYLMAPLDADRAFESQLEALMIGAGDQPEAAIRSVETSRRRTLLEVQGVGPQASTG